MRTTHTFRNTPVTIQAFSASKTMFPALPPSKVTDAARRRLDAVLSASVTNPFRPLDKNRPARACAPRRIFHRPRRIHMRFPEAPSRPFTNQSSTGISVGRPARPEAEALAASLHVMDLGERTRSARSGRMNDEDADRDGCARITLPCARLTLPTVNVQRGRRTLQASGRRPFFEAHN